MTWWQEAVIYQIYPRSFKDSNGDGVGDIPGIIEKLDYLNDGTPGSLGVDAIWLSPIYPSPMFDFGYDISDYSSIDPEFGTMNDFRRLLKEAHKRGIRIIMDLVINHTSHQHPWFLESRSSRDNPKRDWYIWKDPAPGGGEPNNWLGTFGGKGWEWDAATEQYYYHSFLVEQPDLNWRNPEVKAAVFQMIREWLELGVDGFRLDVINLLIKDDQFRDNPVDLFKLARPFDRQRHEYDRDRPELYEILSDFRALLEEFDGDRASVGEIMVEDNEKARRVATFTGRDDYLHMAFNFAYFFSKWDADNFRHRIVEWEAALAESNGGWPTYTLSNHDFVRHISRYSSPGDTQERARVALLMLLTLRGTPFLYYGEEIGMYEEPVARWEMKDPLGLRYWPLHPGRDGCRRPMAWSDGPKGGFTGGNPWLPVSRRYRTENVATHARDPESLLSYYKRAIWYRRGDDVLRKGEQLVLQNTPDGVLAYIREYKTERRLVAHNFKGKSVKLPVLSLLSDAAHPGAGAKIAFSTHAEREGRTVDGEFELKGNEGVVIAVE